MTTDAKLSQLALNALKRSTVTPAQVEDLINNDILKIVSESIRKDERLAEQLEAFIADDELREVCQAHLDGKTVSISIEEE